LCFGLFEAKIKFMSEANYFIVLFAEQRIFEVFNKPKKSRS